MADDLLSAHARYAAYAARAGGFAFRSLDGADGYLFEVSDGARRALFAAGAGSPYALNDARAASLAKDKAFCAIALSEAGIPVVPGEKYFVTERWSDMRTPGRELAQARAYVQRQNFPIFCKPLAASNGLFAEIITDLTSFDDYAARVAREHFAVLIQPYVRGAEYRVFVLEGRALFAYRKHPPRVVGDGASSVRALIAALSRENPVHVGRARDEGGGAVTLDHVPAQGACIELESPANRAAGGTAGEPFVEVPPPLAQIALAGAAALGLGLAAADVFDVSPAGDLSALHMIEVNSNPMIKTLEDHGRWDLISEIWRANFAVALR